MIATSTELVTVSRPTVDRPLDDISTQESQISIEQEPDHISLAHVDRLPPVDRGKDAYLFLAAAWAIEALVWGFPFAFGIFQDYYSTHAPFEGSPNISVIGTCAMGLMYLTAPLTFGLCRIFARWARWTPIVGLFIMSISLAASSFCDTVPQLIAFQGCLYAVGGGIAYAPCILYLDEWFVRRKGLAYGIMWSGTGIAGVVLPLLFEALLRSLGFQTTLRLWAGVLFAITAPLAFFIKPRVPVSRNMAANKARPFNFKFLLLPSFLVYQSFNILEATGFFLPAIYLPTYARSVFASGSLPSATTVLLVNVASVVGCVTMGSLTDRLHVVTCILVSTAGATLCVFLVWGLASSLAGLYAFCLLYGLFAGSYTSAWPGIMRAVMEKAAASDVAHSGSSTSTDAAAPSPDNSNDCGGNISEKKKYGPVDTGMVFAWLAAGRGIGNVISGPLSEGLLDGTPWLGQAAGGYGSGYGGLIVFTGVTATLGGGSYIWKRAGVL
ncbi:major facilitator superfamily domain-containing protein [Apiospora saccharicola]|uniref:Major facilitator superfamily domain-containing protein n=1 Tax=Apiospora saccharicola TaxID=335842 RepID=A0ABR1VMF8_9PEZI